jgi:hypothetical protein
MINLEKISDKELYAQCKKWGRQALEAKHKFEGLLPEVNRRRLYERRGFETIYDFARILAGLSRDQVNRIFCVSKKLEDKPMLHKLLIEGEVSVNKLSRVISIATTENQQDLAEKVKTLSQKAIEITVREIRESDWSSAQSTKNQIDIFENTNGSHKPTTDVRTQGTVPTCVLGEKYFRYVRTQEIDPKSRASNINRDIKLMQILTEEMKEKLLELAEKGLDINKILTELLQEREQKIDQKMLDLRQKQASAERSKMPTRHIPTRIQKVIKQKYGAKCSAPGCTNKAAQLHHQKPFVIHKTHDPAWIKPLCKGHHELRHAKLRDLGAHV